MLIAAVCAMLTSDNSGVSVVETQQPQAACLSVDLEALIVLAERRRLFFHFFVHLLGVVADMTTPLVERHSPRQR